MKLLLVDDCNSIFKIVEYVTKDIFECTYADGTDSAVKILEGGLRPDVIVSDLNMPGKNGEAFLAWLKADERFAGIPFMVLSAENRSETRVRLLKAGADDFMTKPFNPAELLVKLQKMAR